MIVRQQYRGRSGATIIECAVIYPLTFLLFLGTIIGGLGVFRYQEVTWLAREGARIAAVQGSEYQKDTGKTSPTQTEIKTSLLAKAQAMSSSKVTVQVKWVDVSTGNVVDWDSSSKNPTTTDASGQQITNRVRVIFSYDWVAEAFLIGTIKLTSTCEIPMSY